MRLRILLPLLIVLALQFAPALPAHGETLNERLSGVAGTAGVGFGAATQDTLSEKIGALIKAFLGLVGVIFVVLLVHGGYVWMSSGGNEENVKKAKHELTAATIGLIIVIAAFSITQFLLTELVSIK